ncbi:hypothetical protein D4764_17G0000060 [Takifugu flavidus]|uniref:Uncharacterized protein n=1 Tax=Takifugu flavidus TaxID=433684 RepID=A0A5C6NSS1_9TELE|nr:hypothetical protein D4764_17G0000060 [Takifugu flavidus]
MEGGHQGPAVQEGRWGSRWDVARGSWGDHMSEMSLSGRDSIPQEGGRNARVRRAVRISSIVAQETIRPG